MKVDVYLDVKRTAFYDALKQALLEDVREVHPNVKEEEIQSGYKYKKMLSGKMKQESKCTIKIVELKENERYKATVKSDRGVTTMCYDLEDEEDGTRVIYEEEFISDKGINQANHKLVMFFYSRSSKKKMEKRLRQIETYIKYHSQAE
ncbi:MAG: DUF3284 domain-containing protein [Anaerorhabdus sp.]